MGKLWSFQCGVFSGQRVCNDYLGVALFKGIVSDLDALQLSHLPDEQLQESNLEDQTYFRTFIIANATLHLLSAFPSQGWAEEGLASAHCWSTLHLGFYIIIRHKILIWQFALCLLVELALRRVPIMHFWAKIMLSLVCKILWVVFNIAFRSPKVISLDGQNNWSTISTATTFAV